MAYIPETETKSISVLLLEDQGLVRAGMRELIHLAAPNAVVHETATYEEALANLRGNKVDFAFLDFDLKAGRTGLDLLNDMREQEINTRAIMLSGCSEKDLVLQCIQAGANGFIPKDIEDNDIFRKALDIVLQGGIFLPANVMGHKDSIPAAPDTGVALTPEALGVSGKALEVLGYLCQGLPNKSIARKMNIEEGTIRKDYVPKLFRIFKVARRTELLVEVARMGLKLPVVI